MKASMTKARLQNVILFVIAIFWQSYIIINTGRHHREIENLSDELGVVYSPITKWFLAICPHLWVVPVLCIILFIMVSIRAKKELTTFNIALNSIIVGMLLHAWAIEAVFTPFITLMSPIN